MKRFLLGILAAFGILFPGLSARAADSAPQFPGGEKALTAFISENLKYPQMAEENGIEGVVDVAFIVKSDGSISTIKIVRMIDPDLEQEAVRLVKIMPAWIPARANGAAVDAPASVQIPFTLP